MGRGTDARVLETLARSYGVQTSYRAFGGTRVRASRDALAATLAALGASIDRGPPVALDHRRAELTDRAAEPVAVSWGGGPAVVTVRTGDRHLSCTLALETGEERRFPAAVSEAQTDRDGVDPSRRDIIVPAPLPFGYHRLHLEEPDATVLIVAAPERAPAWTAGGVWGAFLPLYAARSARSWGVGDLSDLRDLMAWIGSLGGRLFATLPLMAGFLDELFEPSPYSPVSRLFWNEEHIDVTAVADLASCREARDVADGLGPEIASLEAQELVDHRRTMALKRSVLEPLARWFLDGGPPARRDAFASFATSTPDLDAYARFRAACEARRTPWWEWPEPEWSGSPPDAGDPAVAGYHRYVQWIASEQMEHVRAAARDRGVGMYLDLPVGVNRAGFDVWRRRTSFALGASVGAPPDPLAPDGQHWGFPPLHPERIREQGYGYVIESLRRIFRQADAVRLDHVLGLRRLFWIPDGFEAKDGCYVRNPLDELFAVVTLEAHREGTVVVGEDLGIDARPVRARMGRHGWYRTYVVQERAAVEPDRALLQVPPEAVVSANTHDMPPFAAFWAGLDDRTRALFAEQAGINPDADPRAVLEACVRLLASGEGAAVTVNLEDLWGETRSQNVPGTGPEVPNWRLRARHSLEEMMRMPQVLDTLSAVNARRTGTRTPSPG